MPTPLGAALLQAQAGSGVPAPNVAQVAPTNFTQANSDYNTAMEQAYQAKLGQQNALWGGLAGLGSAGILVAPKLLGSSATGATTGSGSAIANQLGLGNLGSDISDEDILNSIAATSGAAPSIAGPVAAATGAADATADAGATAAAAGGGSDVLASLLALFA